MHFFEHKIDLKFIEEYAQFAEDAGVDVLEVGNGWGYRSNIAELTVNEIDMIECAQKNLNNTKLSIHLNPDFCTIEEFNQIKHLVNIVRLSCTPKDVYKLKPWINIDNEKWACIMFSSSVSREDLKKAFTDIHALGFDTCIIFDSAGNYTPNEVRERIKIGKDIGLRMGFHGHNNLQLAIANSLIDGIDIIDATMNGVGSGAGNAPIEILVHLVPCKINVEKIMNKSSTFEYYPLRRIENIHNALKNKTPLFPNI
jgi:4-hydroxy 2-oxovalerate aldolase